jgi:hypothetical protein
VEYQKCQQQNDSNKKHMQQGTKHFLSSYQQSYVSITFPPQTNHATTRTNNSLSAMTHKHI